MLFFRSEDHIDRWCQSWRSARGGFMSLDTVWKLANAWYGPDRRKPEWRRRTVDEAEQLFRELGLTGAFWSLR